MTAPLDLRAPAFAEAPSRWRHAARSVAPAAAIVTGSVAFRLPVLVNAAATHSDAAVVGLQAMHLLRGEWSWFLWGSGYQTSVDSAVAALWFLLLGPTPLALRLSTLAGHVLLTYFAFSMLRRHLAPWTAALLTLPLVFAPGPLHTYVLYPPRQASLTLVFAGLWAIDRAHAARRPAVWLAAGSAVGLLATFADPYAMLFVPAVLALGVLASADPAPGAPRPRFGNALACAAGALVGTLPKLALSLSPQASLGQQSLTTEVVAHNAKLLLDPCLPYVLGYGVYYAQHGLDYEPWRVGAAFHAVQLAGALALVAGTVSGAALLFVRAIPWQLRRLGAVGALMLPITIGGFLLSPMVMDLFSTRYLAAIVLMAPLALAPAVYRLGGRRAALALAPYLVSAAVASWLNYSPAVDGPWIRTAPGRAEDEHRLEQVLASRGIRYAMADYWASYRLTFLYREAAMVVPTNEREDRYAPYRAAFDEAPVVAYIYDPLRSREDLAATEQKLRAGEPPFEAGPERLAIGRFTVFVLRRR